MKQPTIEVIDLRHEGIRSKIAVFLVHGPDGAVLIETGPSSSLGVVRSALSDRGIDPAAIRDVLVTHIHLDHSGAAGWWARQGARVHVHPKGAPHLLDPGKLIASATRIWGPRMDELWGEIAPVTEDRLRVVHDGDRIRAGGLEIEVIETPGHADHHHAFRLADTVFTGDVAGITAPGTNLLEAPTPPPEFRLEQWHASIQRLRALRPARLMLTHFGAVDEVDRHLDDLDTLLDDVAGLVRDALDLPPAEIAIRYRKWNEARLQERGLDPEAIAFCRAVNPPSFNVGGVIRYWTKRLEAGA